MTDSSNLGCSEDCRRVENGCQDGLSRPGITPVRVELGQWHDTYAACSEAKPSWTRTSGSTPGKRCGFNGRLAVSPSVKTGTLHRERTGINLSFLCESQFLHCKDVRALVRDNHFIKPGVISNEPCSLCSEIQEDIRPSQCTHSIG